MNRSLVLPALCLIFIGAPVNTVRAKEQPQKMGLSVAPGRMCIQNVVPGESFNVSENTGISIIITNKSNKKRTYSITVTQPLESHMKNTGGYSFIPELDWFRLERQSVEVAAYGKEKMNVFIEVPAKEKYYNQKWFLRVRVSSKPQKGENLALEITSVYYIETQSKAGPNDRPYGTFGLSPSEITISLFKQGGNEGPASFKIYNNTSKPCEFKISSFVPGLSGENPAIFPSPGYFPVPDESWIKLNNDRLSLLPGETGEVGFKIDVPGDKRYMNKRYEGLILVRSEDGSSDFVRVKLIPSTRGGEY